MPLNQPYISSHQFIPSESLTHPPTRSPAFSHVLEHLPLTHATWRVMCQAQVKKCVVCDWGGSMQTRERRENNMCDSSSQHRWKKTVVDVLILSCTCRQDRYALLGTVTSQLVNLASITRSPMSVQYTGQGSISRVDRLFRFRFLTHGLNHKPTKRQP